MDFKFNKSNMNFRVYSATETPESGVENDIVIITNVPMSNWILSPDNPTGIPRTDGDVWLRYSVSGDTFNALKQNSMMISTISAWQYIGGAWVDVEAKCYQGGEWKAVFSVIHIVENGVINPEYSFSLSQYEQVRQDPGYYSVYGNNSGYHTAWITDIDLTHFKTLTIDGTFRVDTGFELCVWDKATSAPDYQNHIATTDLTATGAVLNVSGLRGVHSIGITNVYTHQQKIVNMWLE